MGWRSQGERKKNKRKQEREGVEEEPKEDEEKNEGGTEEDIKKVKKRRGRTTKAKRMGKSGWGRRQSSGRPGPTDSLYASADEILRSLAAQLGQAQRLCLDGLNNESPLRARNSRPN